MTIQDEFDKDPRELEKEMFARREDSQRVALAEDLIRSKLPQSDDTIYLINQIVDDIKEDREITQVEQICRYGSVNMK